MIVCLPFSFSLMGRDRGSDAALAVELQNFLRAVEDKQHLRLVALQCTENNNSDALTCRKVSYVGVFHKVALDGK